MLRDNWTTEENKIAGMIYSNDPVNDRLVLEIVKNRNKPVAHLLPLMVGVATSLSDKEVTREYIAFLKNKVSPAYSKHISDRFKTGNLSLDSYYAKSEFSRQERAEIYFTHYKRGKNAVENFLRTDRWEHPCRAEVFDAFLASKSAYGSHSLELKMFSKEELKTYLNHPNINFNRCKYLIVEDEILSNIPEEVLKIPFTRMLLSKCIAAGFPDFIFNFPHLQELRIHGIKIEPIPKDWSRLSELETLTFQSTEHVFSNFEFLDSLPKLKKLMLAEDLIENPYLLISEKRIPLGFMPKFKNLDNFELHRGRFVFALPMDDVLSLGSAIAKSKLSEIEKKHYFRLVSQLPNYSKLPELPIWELAALSMVNLAKLRQVCKNRLDDLAASGEGMTTLDEASLVWIIGAPGMKKTELVAQLKELNLKSTSKFSPEVTHVLIGKNPKDYIQLKDFDFKLISENQLAKLYNAEKPKFIQEASESGDNSLSEKVLELLQSPETTNVNVGLELLKTGGVPDNLVEDLIVIQKTCPDAKARKSAKKLLQQNASPELLPIVNDSQRFTAIMTEKAQATNKKLEAFAKKNSRELAAKLSLLFFEKLGRGLRYVLYHFHNKSDIRNAALNAMVTEKCFDYHKGLGFKTWKDPQTATLWNMKIPANVKFDVLELHPDIEKMILHNCKMHKLSKGIGFAKALKSLDCSFNFLNNLPDSIGNCKNLEELNLQMNLFTEFPETLLHIKSLKKIDLRFQRPDGHSFTPIVLSAAVRSALPNCEILV